MAKLLCTVAFYRSSTQLEPSVKSLLDGEVNSVKKHNYKLWLNYGVH